jgi:SagB-type dehydrogenase family enzyme
MRIEWSVRLSRLLDVAGEDRLFEFYHENSKLFPELAAEQAATFVASSFELYVQSRGFRQFRAAPRIPLPEATPSDGGVAAVLGRRRSSRDLGGRIGLDELAALLRQALGPTAVVENEEHGVAQALRAWPSGGGLYPLDAYVVASKVDAVAPGLYHYNVIRGELEQLPSRAPDRILRDGFFWQEFVATAATAVLLVAVFERTVAKYGERGYRLVLLDAGHAAQNLLLVAEDLGLGAVAVAGFCDDALADDLAVDGVSEAVLHAVVVGRPEASHV